MLGQFCMLGDPYETIRTRYSDATVVREPLVPHRGAVANLYKTHDLVKLVAYVEEVSKVIFKSALVCHVMLKTRLPHRT
jgi:hypothetical protein